MNSQIGKSFSSFSNLNLDLSVPVSGECDVAISFDIAPVLLGKFDFSSLGKKKIVVREVPARSSVALRVREWVEPVQLSFAFAS